MKKIFLAMALLAVLGNVKSQNFRLGIKGGANLTKITGKAFSEAFDVGYQLGAFAEIDLSKSIGIQPEIIFNQVNVRRASGIDSVFNGWRNNTNSIKLNYLTIPILLRINLNKLLTLNVGPQFGILLNKTETLWNNGKEAVKSGELSAVGGLTLNLTRLRVYGRYAIGLNNINDLENSDNWKSQQMQFGVGVKL